MIVVKGLLIDYKWCTGCHTCEIACQVEHGYEPKKLLEKGKVGIKPYEIGPYEIAEDRYQYEFLPVPTDFCDLCKERVAKGKQPTCVKHCQAGCMYYGELEDLVKKMDSEKMSLFI